MPLSESFDPYYSAVAVPVSTSLGLVEENSRQSLTRLGCDMRTFQYLGVLDEDTQPTHVWTAFKRVRVEQMAA